MASKPLDICKEFDRDSLAKFIGMQWFNLNSGRSTKIAEWKELRNYIFATDTSTTSNSALPWKNSTTLPKICQIRDNLHSNYLSALFPNDDWMTWVAYSQKDATRAKRDAIQAYMSNKAREGHMRTEVSKLLYDYIDYGNAFATVDFVNEFRMDDNGERIQGFVGPKIRRISPLDIVFSPMATSFKDTFKIIRSIRTVGELLSDGEDNPDNHFLKEAIEKRHKLVDHANAYALELNDKEEGLMMDGFGSYQEYLQSGYVEVLEFWGDMYDPEARKLSRGRVVTVIDRMWVIRNDAIPGWMGGANIFHVGWRNRPDNLWSMGPLDNLVGMQYRIDHLENLKADAMDLAVLPPLVVAGQVEEFDYAPGSEIHIDEGGTVTELARNVQWVLQADNAISLLEQRMEMYAGAPREAMGMRSPGEKTAFEVDQIMTAGSRIFQEKINTFETELLERALNAMLEVSRRNMDRSDTVRVMDDDIGVETFLEVTKEDITASGVLRPIGARHFAAQAQLMQNLTQLYQSNIGNIIAPHTSGKKLSQLVEQVLGLNKYGLYSPNVAIFETQETQRLAGQAQEDLEVEAQTPVGVL